MFALTNSSRLEQYQAPYTISNDVEMSERVRGALIYSTATLVCIQNTLLAFSVWERVIFAAKVFGTTCEDLLLSFLLPMYLEFCHFAYHHRMMREDTNLYSVMCDTASKKISNVYVLLHFTTAVDDDDECERRVSWRSHRG